MGGKKQNKNNKTQDWESKESGWEDKNLAGRNVPEIRRKRSSDGKVGDQMGENNNMVQGAWFRTRSDMLKLLHYTAQHVNPCLLGSAPRALRTVIIVSHSIRILHNSQKHASRYYLLSRSQSLRGVG